MRNTANDARTRNGPAQRATATSNQEREDVLVALTYEQLWSFGGKRLTGVSERHAIDQALRTLPPPRSFEQWMVGLFAAPQFRDQVRNRRETRLRCTDIEYARLVATVVACDERNPVERAEQRPCG